ncbi:MAG: poly-gamma-glutamate biosynthesis protein PgsC/CapC [Mariprofundus sp.]
MIDIFPLAIFPETSLASSVVTTVWVGVFVVAFFNLRLGWVLSGLVVPGYLVPLLISKPWSAGVLLLEGVLTYWIVWLFSECFSGHGRWSNLFGRDRFFALFLVSVAVRIVMDGWLLPVAGASFNDWLGIHFDYRNNLHSFGLIIVALVANQFWKTGLIRGFIPLLVTVGLTWLIVRFGLMEFTNFSISGINYLYEDIASSMLASPKAYIILIVTALIASRMNLHYGWDFNGILIPALLALQWYQPSKILISFGEAFIIYGLAIWVLRAPFFQQMSIEGGRKLLLFFNVGFLYKLLLGYLLLWFLPEYKATDFFAFGYLLSTLIAIKMHDKGIAARLTRATVQTSLVAVVVASIVGFALTFLPDLWSWPVPPASTRASALSVNQDARLIDLVRQDKVAMYQSRSTQVDMPLPQELDTFAHALEQLQSYAASQQPSDLAGARDLLARVNYSVSETAAGLLYLREMEPRRGWGVYVLRMNAINRLAIEVPAPLDERGTAEAGVAMFELNSARALAIGGSQRRANPDGTADVLRNYQTIFNIFHRELATRDALQVRGYERERFTALRHRSGSNQPGQPGSGLWVKSDLPEGLNIKEIKAMVGDLPVSWGRSPVEGIQREMSRGHYAELVLDIAAIRRVQAGLLLSGNYAPLQERDQGITGYLLEWILGSKESIAQRGTNLYVVPKAEELLYFDEEVLTPLLGLIEQRRSMHAWSDAELDQLKVLDAAAAIIGYQVTRYRHRESGHEYLIVSEKGAVAQRRYWGSYVFRVEQGQGFIVQVPRPIFEANSFEAGVALFASLRAEALLIVGADPNANSDHSADMLSMHNRASMFNLVNQVMLREAGERNMMSVQSRAFGVMPDRPTPDSGALLAFDNGAHAQAMLTPLAVLLAERVRAAGLNYRFVDGSPATAGYEVNNLPQAKYLQQSSNKELAALWLSPVARWGFRQQGENRMQQAQFHALGIASREESLYRQLAMAASATAAQTLPQGLRQALQHYLETQDVVSLYRAQTQYPAYRLQGLLDHDSQRAFLLVYQRQRNSIALVLNLSAQDFSSSRSLSGHDDPGGVAAFIASGAAWLEIGGGL